jgi:hypothetical protein
MKDTERPPQHWKRKAALAIGRPELANASDEELEAAHDAHKRHVSGSISLHRRADRTRLGIGQTWSLANSPANSFPRKDLGPRRSNGGRMEHRNAS